MLQHPVPGDLLVHIGDITVSFALLELVIQQLLASLIGEHQAVPRIIVNLLPFKRLRQAVLSLYLERHGRDEHFATLERLMKQAGEIEDKRNLITHSIWAAGSAEGTITRVKSTTGAKGASVQVEEYDEPRLRDVAERIKAVAGQIQRFYLDLLDRGKLFNNPLQRMW